ncbi:MAG: glycoside hydrolase family 15 protein, partial [Actinomycetota bacterium]|nr:glycoside hydrolase family 15 protein [Actinomycetota bacterium]
MRAIADHALIGDCHSSALIDKAGSVSWACFPRFDSPSVFCRILDEERGGSFDVRPHDVTSICRAYLDGTNVLVTTFTCAQGVLEVTDCMPVQATGPTPGEVRPCASILRRLRCTDGTVSVDVSLTPRFEYGRFVPRFRCATPTTGQIVGGADALWVSATRPLQCHPEAISGSWSLTADESAWVDVAWSPSVEERAPEDMPGEAELADRLQQTIDFWRHWLANCAYDGDYREQVLRSALTLKALIYAPSGAVVAAPTTSLPEEIGGERNWDYRYTWIRDATLTLCSLVVLGFEEEAAAFKAWLERTGAGRPQDLQIMYGICGERMLPEIELDHLDGHRGSRPVRVGNGAVKQLQLDCYGQLLQSAYLFGRLGGELTDDNWAFLSGLADIVVDRWKEPDQGIWEVRDEGRHFVHSKLNCWMALDRAVRIAEARGQGADAGPWRRERDALAAYLVEEAAADGWF